jgi:hypothetical protein
MIKAIYIKSIVGRDGFYVAHQSSNQDTVPSCRLGSYFIHVNTRSAAMAIAANEARRLNVPVRECNPIDLNH